MSVVEDFQEIAPLLGRERRQAPVIQDQELDARQRLEQATVTAIAAREQQVIEQPRQAMVEDRAVVAAGLVAERTGKPTLADAGRAHDILRRNSPLRLSLDIRIIHSPESESLSFVASSMPIWCTLSSKGQTDV